MDRRGELPVRVDRPLRRRGAFEEVDKRYYADPRRGEMSFNPMDYIDKVDARMLTCSLEVWTLLRRVLKNGDSGWPPVRCPGILSSTIGPTGGFSAPSEVF